MQNFSRVAVVVAALLSSIVLVSCNGGGGGSSSSRASADETRSFDGSGNNPEQSRMGGGGTHLARMAPEEYDDSMQAPAGSTRPNPRDISNLVFSQRSSVPSELGLSGMAWLWGQFLDHDIDLTPRNESEPLPISIPSGDPHFDPEGTGQVTIMTARSVYDPETGHDPDTPRQQMNMISSWIDASNVYGSSEERANWLRTFEGGRLKTSEGGFLPFNDGSQENEGGPSPRLFVAGDIRANEHVGLSAMHTLFVREHNRLVTEIAAENPDLTDEELYQRARRFVGAYMQSITFNEFLPALLGPDRIEPYSGYDPSVSGYIFNEFSTALYRVGHSMVHSTLLRIDESGQPIAAGPMSLRDAFFQPHRLISEGGLDPVLRGMAVQVMEEIDTNIVDDLRNFLFGRPGSGGLDLATLNIQRGRDHGIADYNTVRESLGLPRRLSFQEITSNGELATTLEALYVNIDNIDLWVGGLSEDHLPDSNVGETIGVMLSLQFQNLRDGDRFWYQNDNYFLIEEIREITATRLSDILKRNTGIEHIQENVFMIPPENF